MPPRGEAWPAAGLQASLRLCRARSAQGMVARRPDCQPGAPSPNGRLPSDQRSLGPAGASQPARRIGESSLSQVRQLPVAVCSRIVNRPDRTGGCDGDTWNTCYSNW